MDPIAIEKCAQYITGDRSLCRAEVLQGHLREAYLIAVRITSIEDVYIVGRKFSNSLLLFQVLDEARKMNNISVISLCEKYLSQLGVIRKCAILISISVL